MKIAQEESFKKDVTRQRKRGKDLSKLNAAITFLYHQKFLTASYRDRALIGNWRGWRDCHIEADWLLIYKLTDSELRLARTGTHTDIFQ